MAKTARRPGFAQEQIPGSTSERTARPGSPSTSPTRRSRSTRSPRSVTAPGSIDDFGLTRAGIVYRFNDGDEKTLILQDFPARQRARNRRRRRSLEEMLLLETLNASPLDSVTYYAFAEDNYPGKPRRTETDLRYIDFRVLQARIQAGASPVRPATASRSTWSRSTS